METKAQQKKRIEKGYLVYRIAQLEDNLEPMERRLEELKGLRKRLGVCKHNVSVDEECTVCLIKRELLLD